MSIFRRLRQRVFPGRASAFLFWLTLLALVIRLVWNLFLHPPGNFITSDMHSYWTQSNAFLKTPWRRDGSTIFFPYGTAALLTLFRAIFGAENHVALAIVYAVLGTLLVPLVYRIAERLTRTHQLPRVAAVITCFYYPFISYGGYYLSELPFSVCLTAATYYSLRLAERGRARDAYAFGAAMALGAIFRPQILGALPLLFVIWVWRRKSWLVWRGTAWFRIALPILLVLTVSGARFYYHTGRLGLISGNSALNYTFGRCHALTIESRAVNYYGSFSPPPMGYLEWRDKHRPDSFIRLDAALGTQLSLKGTMWTPETFTDVTHRCIKQTGYLRQAKYAITHVLMLWSFNNAWPDSAGGAIRYVMLVALGFHNGVFLFPALLMLIASFRRRFFRHALVGAHLLVLPVIAIIYFGDVRFRVPYDALFIILALDGWRHIWAWLVSRRWRRWV